MSEVLASWPLGAVIALFAAGGAAVTLAGTSIAGVADRLADRTGLGEAFIGALAVGASTSLSGCVVSAVAAADARPALALGNALGGIAAQTAFLAVADLAHRGANLEHAAASLPNLLQGALLIGLLALPLVAIATPGLAVLGVHPVSLLLLGGYLFGLRLAREARGHPMWRPRRTRATRIDRPDPEGIATPLARLLPTFLALAVVLGAGGFVLARTGAVLSERTALSASVVGVAFTAVATSLPELVTAVAAVRRGALQLAVGTILGGNVFDVLLVALSDAVYPGGTIYPHAPRELLLVVGATQLMTAILLLGMLRREEHGIANIGFESVLVLAIYVAMLPLLAAGGAA